MRAVVLPEFGSAPVVLDVDLPEPAEGEVRVHVRAASVNGFDLAVANGYLQGAMEHRFPVVLGKDFAGTIDALGDGVEGYAIGDRVFGVVTKSFLGDGSFGEYVTVPVAVGLATIPDGIDFATAAAFGLAGSAAVDSVDGAELVAGQTVLIAGATGGVGNQVLQLAVAAGAHVIATAHSEAERAQVTALGASEIVDYLGDIVAQVKVAHPAGVDAVVHLAGDPVGAITTVTSGGRFVSTMLGSPDQVSAEGVTVVAVMANPALATLNRIADHHTSGTTTVTIQQVYSLDTATDALADFGKGTLGKLVISLD